MMTCEGYRMFQGTAMIVPTSGKMATFEMHGTWLYKPEYDCWYCNGRSFPAEIVTNIAESARANTESA